MSAGVREDVNETARRRVADAMARQGRDVGWLAGEAGVDPGELAGWLADEGGIGLGDLGAVVRALGLAASGDHAGYFTGKARAVLEGNAGADPRMAGGLAAWAERIWGTGRAKRAGVLVDVVDGHLICETWRDIGSGVFYALGGDQRGYEWQQAAFAHLHATGHDVMHVKAWQVCSGPRARVTV